MENMDNCVKVKNIQEANIKETGEVDLTCSETKACEEPMTCCNGECILQEFTCNSLELEVGETCQLSTDNVEWNMCADGLDCLDNTCADPVIVQAQIIEEQKAAEAAAKAAAEAAGVVDEVADDTLIIGLAIGGGVIALIVLGVCCIFISRKCREREVRKHPVGQSDDDNSQEMSSVASDRGGKDNTKLKLEDMSDNDSSTQANKTKGGSKNRHNDSD